MFQKIDSTKYAPHPAPLMVWDGECGFCAYWTRRWASFSNNKVHYEPYQSAAHRFPDIDVIHFKQASRLIEADGSIYSGPRSAYRTFTYGSKWAFLDKWYENSALFRKLSDGLYQWIADHRNFLFKVTKAMFGSDPDSPRPFWAIYICLIAYLIYSVSGF